MARKHLLLATSFLALAGSVAPAIAGRIEKGIPSKGFYWAEEEGLFGKRYYECFEEKTNKRANTKKCIDAKAVKPVKTIE
jgi:hypothetical protein